MKARTVAFVLVGVATALGAVAWMVGLHFASITPARTPIAEPPVSTAPVAAATTNTGPSAISEAVAAKDLRTEFQTANDYAAFADSLRGAAQSGDSSAQYYLAESLRYCQQNLSRFFMKSGKPVRTLDEAQQRWANRPAGYQAEIVQIHSRCHVFLEDPERLGELDEWRAWLDKASTEGVPLAQATKADLMRIDALIASVSTDPGVHFDPQAAATARDLALEALKSGDPAVIWMMQDFVDGTGALATAWQLLACERGYDCSARAEWLRAACDFDQLCNPGDTGKQYLERQLGDKLDAARQMAQEIGAALDRGDWSKLPAYLGAGS